MKKLLCFLTFAIIIGSVYANKQMVYYNYKALSAEACRFQYSVTKQDTSYYIIVSILSIQVKFNSEPTMKIKTFNGDILTIQGDVDNTNRSPLGVVSWNVVLPISFSSAYFKVTPEQFEQLKCGVSKIRLSTTPVNHEKTFKKDKIGKKIYQFYIKEKSHDENF